MNWQNKGEIHLVGKANNMQLGKLSVGGEL